MRKGVMLSILMFIAIASMPLVNGLIQFYNEDYMTIAPTAANIGLLIDQDNNDISFKIINDGTEEGIYIDQNGNGDALRILNDGTGSGLFIDQNTDAKSIYFDSEATTSPITQWNGEASKLSGHLADKDSAQGSYYFFRNVDSAESAGPVMFIEQDHATDDARGLHIQQDGTGDSLFIDTNGDATSLSISSSATTSNVMELQNVGTGDGLYINQDGDGKGLFIDSVASSLLNFALHVSVNGNGANPAQISFDSNDFYRKTTANNANGANWFYRNDVAADTNGPVVFIEEDAAGDDARALHIQQDGTGDSLFIDTNGEATSLSISSSATTSNVMELQNVGTGDGLYINQDGDGISLDIDSEATSQPAIKVEADQGANVALFRTSINDYYQKGATNNAIASHVFYRNLDSGTTVSPVLVLEQDHATDDQNAMKIQNDGTGDGLYIDQDGEGRAIEIDTEATSQQALYVDMPNAHTATTAYFQTDANDYVGLLQDRTGTQSNMFYRNLASAATGGAIVRIQQDNAGDDQANLYMINDGTGHALHINQDGDSGASTSTGGAILLDNTGNEGAGMIIYSNIGGTADGRLLNIRADNTAFDNAAFHIDYDGNANAAEISCGPADTSSQCLNVVSTNDDDTTVGISGTQESRGTLKITHTKPTAADAGSSALSIWLAGAGTAAYGIYMDTDVATTGDLMDLRNNGSPMFDVDADGEIRNAGTASDGTGKVVCIKADGFMGTCTDQPNGSGVCTCA